MNIEDLGYRVDDLEEDAGDLHDELYALKKELTEKGFIDMEDEEEMDEDCVNDLECRVDFLEGETYYLKQELGELKEKLEEAGVIEK